MAGDTRERIMESARLTVQDLGYGGLSFRELAKDVGIKSASIHYYFPTKGDLGEAILRRYVDRYAAFLDGLLDGLPGTGADRAALMGRYTDMFRSTLLNGNRLCLAGMLSAERNELPAGICAEIVRWGAMNEGWIARVLGLGGAGDREGLRSRAAALFAAVSGAQVVAHGRNDVAVYDDIIAAYRASGLVP
ncbi:TetR/AcrR family transcriptional regulator [Methylobacterium platani]|uniref:Transcriptional regulator n=2 Tax=Methylobacterium platani TaxID=427683 RepID=A0A179SBI6_9HYPH|nr:TetR/AcrR family transcriptional regulator [Methylobacterium platani]KMO13618.1 transcriptional regulator [Methylobacterium platani JCM 14648]OAS25216.1 transcriptional regulator [Methylobacterium platani]